VTFKDTTTMYSSYVECREEADRQDIIIRDTLGDSPESFSATICMNRNYSKIGDL
jgi:hypothetical protein